MPMARTAGGSMVPIPRTDLPRMVGKPTHLAWANRGCVWILDRIEGDRLHCRTPKTKRPFVGKAADACYTRRHEPASRRPGGSNHGSV